MKQVSYLFSPVKGQLISISFEARESSFNNSRVLQLVALKEGLSVHQARQVHRLEVRHRLEPHHLQAVELTISVCFSPLIQISPPVQVAVPSKSKPDCPVKLMVPPVTVTLPLESIGSVSPCPTSTLRVPPFIVKKISLCWAFLLAA